MHWYRRFGRDLPWRHTRDPYAVLVSEVMLQQTQVATVIPYYNDWLRRFPGVGSLARASENDVLHAWQGLGYYNRARNLHAAARTVQEQHGGIFPVDLNAIHRLPGVGRYTANAIATFAFDRSVPIVETNTARVLARLFNVRFPIDSSIGREKLWASAAHLVPLRAAGRFNSALVDLGALICLPRQPRCTACPVKRFCRATNPENLPLKKARPKTKRLTEVHGLIIQRRRILLEQSNTRWRGMWILPPTTATTARPIHTSIFPFTNHRITLKVFAGESRKSGNRKQRWFPIKDLDSIPIPSPHRRALAELSVGR